MIKEIVIKPIGKIETPFKSKEDLKIPPFKPEAPYHDPKVTGTLHIFDEYLEGIADIKPNSKAILIFYFDRAEGYDLTSNPSHFHKPRGVFSTRSPRRPNGLGISVVEFISIEGSKITFTGVDMLDGTPLLDIKPYDVKKETD